ncbi:MAG: hypothetical protein IKT40_02635 [Bacilli bacterium]|nr:hypothetical protein [Bacilli bacterium]
MNKDLKSMSIVELNELKNIVNNISEKYSKQLLTHGISDTEEYLSSLHPSQRVLLEKRMKMVRLVDIIDSLIEEKIGEYYDEIS